MEIQKIKCPYCGSLDLEQKVDGTYKCNDCGQVIKPDLKGQVSNIASGTLSAGANLVAEEASRKRVMAGILALFFGVFGIHYFYLGKTKKGITILLIDLIPIIGLLINWIRGIVFGVKALTSSDDSFYRQLSE